MTVRELINALRATDPGLLVVLQKDAEGNSFSPLAGADMAYYVADNAWSGTAYDEEGVWGAPRGGQMVVKLRPVN